MMNKLLLPGSFLFLLCGAAYVNALPSAPSAGPGYVLPTRPEGGTFPDQWANGVDCGTEPEIQVHAYNDDFYILRQGKCSHFEAPFMFLIFGVEKVLLLDTGSAGNPPIAATVDRIIDHWLELRGLESIELIVAHTHSHGDHVAGDNQFVGRPNTTIVGWGPSAVHPFWGFTDWPNDQVTYDLGGRVLDVFATPGHQTVSITVYDRRTQLLLTGDIIYPGHIFIFSPTQWPVFRASIDRLIAFVETHPVEWVLGCHIEYSSQPGGCLTYGTGVHPDEHVLQLSPRVISNVKRSADQMGDTPVCGNTLEHIVIHPVWLCGITGGC